jgi:hypothetical protein
MSWLNHVPESRISGCPQCLVRECRKSPGIPVHPSLSASVQYVIFFGGFVLGVRVCTLTPQFNFYTVVIGLPGVLGGLAG